MNKFFDSPECRSGSHCRSCRAQIVGANFRRAIAAYFTLPSIDWDCPHGRPWGLDNKPNALPFVANQASAVPSTTSATTAPARTPASSIPSNAEEICHACASRTCPNVTVCCGGRVSITIIAPCPEGRW